MTATEKFAIIRMSAGSGISQYYVDNEKGKAMTKKAIFSALLTVLLLVPVLALPTGAQTAAVEKKSVEIQEVYDAHTERNASNAFHSVLLLNSANPPVNATESQNFPENPSTTPPTVSEVGGAQAPESDRLNPAVWVGIVAGCALVLGGLCTFLGIRKKKKREE